MSRRKYPRTPHLPWSPGASDDDEHLSGCPHFTGVEVVVTEKMDGENTSLYRDGTHARSLDSRGHRSRDWMKAWHGTIAHEIPEDWRLCGENLYARHSIAYEDLESYFYLFSVWTAEEGCLSWDETCEWAALLGSPVPQVFYRGLWDEKLIRSISIDPERQEGYVVRRAEGFAYGEFASSVAKWVRKGHVQTDEHWMYAEIVPNKLRANAEEEKDEDDESTDSA